MNDLFLYIVLGVVSVISAIGLLLSKDAVYAAMFLVLNFVVAAIFYILMNAPFLAAVQVSVYAGAIMVLFIFVIMLLGAERLKPADIGAKIHVSRSAIILCVCLLVGCIAYALTAQPSSAATAATPTFDASPLAIGKQLYSSYSLPFEAVSLLLTVAMVGAVVLTREANKS
jgi:NADH-quinone oxidoreductase subunit J